jgi:hypothetical protein
LKVYQAINAIQRDLAATGVAKAQTNSFDKYKFRGIDDIYNAMAPLLAKHGLCVLPRMLSRACEERESQKGGALFYVTVEAEFVFVSAEDGSQHTVKTFGEAMDRGDKATNKAMSAAYKYACFQSFCIPTEGDNDADAATHEVKSKALEGPITSTQGAMERLTPARQKAMGRVVDAILAHLDHSNEYLALEEYEGVSDPDEKTAMWSLLDSKTRSKLKALKAAADSNETTV